MSPALITHWNDYFKEKGVNHVFVSALEEQKKLDHVITEESEDDSLDEGETEKEFEPLFEDLKKKIDIENELKEDVKEEVKEPVVEKRLTFNVNTTEIFTRDQIMGVLKGKAR